MNLRKQSSFPWFWIILILVLAAGGFYAWTVYRPVANGQESTKPRSPSIRVTTMPVRTGDLAVNLTALGSVVPLNTVTVRTRVNGQLMKIYFQEGQLVNEGDALAEIDPRPYQAALDQAEGQLARDQASLQMAKLDLERYHTLWSQDSIAKQTLDDQEGLVKQDQGTVLADKAAVNAARVNLDYCHITAPVSGKIGLRLVDNGNVVQTTDAAGLVVITQLQPINVLFTLAEDRVPSVLEKMQAGEKLSVEVTDRDRQQKLAQGVLASSDNQIDPTTGTLKFKAIFTNETYSLFPNQFVNVRLLLETKQNVVLAPINAIQHAPQKTFVYVVQPDNTVTVRQVTLGQSNSREAIITQGLSAGETVVVDGIDKLQEGSHITPVPPKEDKSSDNSAAK